LSGLELHLTKMLRMINQFDPHAVVLDPLNSFVTRDNEHDVKLMLIRLVDALKLRGTTALFTSLTSGSGSLEQTDVAVSSLIDTWLLVRDQEKGGERNRGLCVLKSRGMAHSNQVREFTLTSNGIELRHAYVGPSGVLLGSERLAQEAQERAEHLRSDQDILRKQDELLRRREAMEAKVLAIRTEFAAQEGAAIALIEEAKASEVVLLQDRQDMAESRRVEV
jgi:circadian clock protein KaiC